MFPIIFIGADNMSLQALNHLLQGSEFKVKAVVTQKPRPKGRGMRTFKSPVAERAEELSLPVLTPDNLKDPEFLDMIRSLRAEWLILLSYGKILPLVFLSLFPDKALNFHASLLPRWRGAAPIQRAIMAGDKELGMSLQVMTPRLDRGPLIGTRSFKMSMEMDALSVFKKMDFLIQDLLKDLLLYMMGQRVPVPQEDTACMVYAHKIDKKESQIIWSDPALKIFNKIRALVAGPQAYTLCKGKRVKIYKARWNAKDTLLSARVSSNGLGFAGVGAGSNLLDKEGSFLPGQLVETGSDYFKVACGGDSILSIVQVQPESKKIMSAGEYIRGYNLKPGDKFSFF